MQEDFRNLATDVLASGSGALSDFLFQRESAANFPSPKKFCDAFAKFVAVEFARGELSFADGALLMNRLLGFGAHSISGVALEIFQAFDVGEYQRPAEAAGLVPWQAYTLPSIMALLRREGLWPCA
ncbi:MULTISPECIES: hypothetical protein [unclassified Microcoleus]|uniref:hypothetical protein n=1 Tax=unclassified Microcoleus TaxID=2642155 RepID=UPI002FD41ACE